MPFCFIISQGGVSMGFTMKNKNVQFEFITENSFIQTDGETVAEVINRAPTPTITPKDRLLLPVGEGVAINVDEYYESGEFSCDRIGGDFCYGHNGSISMILLERNKNYLAICPNNPVNATYTVKKEDGIYHLSLTCRRKATVCYKVFDSLPEACRWYRKKYNPNCRTLSDKIQKNRQVETLAGGAIFWIWNDAYNDVMYGDRDFSISPASGEGLLD